MANENKTVEQVCESIGELVIAIHDKEHNEKQEIKNVWSIVQQVKDSILAAHKRELAAKDTEITELKRCLRSAARWILTHDIYKNMGQEILDEAKKLLNDNGEFLQPKDG